MNIHWEGSDPEDFAVGRGRHSIEFIVFHWIVGGMQALDREVDNDGRFMSPHFGVDGDQVWQFVKEENTAYHCGNWEYNQRSIGIEHEGGQLLADGVNRKEPTDQTQETSAQLCAELVKKYNIPVDRAHFIGHKEVPGAATACPGSLDIDWIVNRVKEILAAEAPKPEPAPEPAPAPSEFPKTVTVTIDKLRVRKEPNTQSAIVPQPTHNRLLNKGNQFTAVERVTGEDPYGDGRNTWYKSSRGNYVWCGGCN